MTRLPIAAKAEGHVRRAEELAEGIERLLARFRDLEAVPLAVLDRVERAIVQAHTANLLRLTGTPPRRPEPPAGATGSLHDLSCAGPEHCTCSPKYVVERMPDGSRIALVEAS